MTGKAPRTSASRPGRLAPFAAGLAIAVGVGLLAARRVELSYDVETDFVSTFERNADELLAGEPIRLGFHGPLYPVSVAAAHRLLGSDWRAALPISWLGAVVCTVASVVVYGRLFGRGAGFGAGLALVSSQVFLVTAASASSDLLYLALTTGALLCAGAALETGSLRAQGGLGLLLGLALLTRTNALACLPLALAPLLAPVGPGRGRGRGLALLATGLALPLVVWLAFAHATGSTPFPQHTEVGLAATYFPPGADRWSGDANDYNLGRFRSALDVIRYDPRHVAATYLRDLFAIVRADLGSDAILAFPLFACALPGLVAIALAPLSRFAWLVVASLAAQVAFVNLRAYDPRYNLFLIPFLGACAGVCAERVWARTFSRLRAGVLAAGLAALFAVGLRDALVDANRQLHAQDAELAALVPALRSTLPAGAALIARKPHAAFHVGATWLSFPFTEREPELEAIARSAAQHGPVFLYYGSAERYYRPAFSAWLDPAAAPPWLTPRARSPVAGEWALYEVRPAD